MVLFNGESFDYIGSSRLVFDIGKGLFPSKEKPLSLDQIGLIVELDQISGDRLFYHSHSTSSPLVYKILLLLGIFFKLIFFFRLKILLMTWLADLVTLN